MHIHELHNNYNDNDTLFLPADSYLDLGLPLWLGGVPADTSEFLPVQSQGIGACVRNVHINSVLLDLASHVAAERSLPGCSEVMKLTIRYTHTTCTAYIFSCIHSDRNL